MNKKTQPWMPLCYILLIVLSIAVLTILAFVDDNTYVKITAITCFGVVCSTAIICFTVRFSRTNESPRDVFTDEERRELYLKIEQAFSQEPKRICCRCNKISNSIVNVKVHKK